MEFTAFQIAELIGGSIEGNPDVKVSTLAKIEEGREGSITFLANPKYTPFIYRTSASVVVVGRDFVAEQALSSTLIRVDDAYTAFAQLLDLYNKIKLQPSGISERAFVSDNAKVGSDAYIGEFTYIGRNVRIGNNVKIYPLCYIGDNTLIGDGSILFAGVKVYSDIIIGSNCTLHSGAVIGADGFGFAKQESQDYMKVAQIGNVILEDNVEVGANTTIDRATLGSTILRKGVKLDNLIQIAHNVEIGENTVIAAQTGVSGSSHIGKNCMIGGQVGIVGHITIADNVKVAAQSGIAGNVTEEGAILLGSPAIDAARYKKAFVHFRNLPELVTRLLKLEKLSSQREQA
jgi:UDP-3-O-[3-hydroxymyristoyl] glucosamine N-acyltransferase